MVQRNPKSVVEILRKRLGLHQGEFAERAGLSRRTVQNIEYGKSSLSWKSASAISAQFNVSENWLMVNDPSQPMVTYDGKPWTHKDSGKLQRLRQVIDPAFSQALFTLLSEKVIPPLLEDYLQSRASLSVAALIDSEVVTRWRAIQKKAWSEFLKANPAIAKALSREPATREGLSLSDLESIKEDVEMAIQFLPLHESEAAKKAGPKRRQAKEGNFPREQDKAKQGLRLKAKIADTPSKNRA